MTDLAKCQDFPDCRIRYECQRFLSVSEGRGQSWARFEPLKGKECSGFVPVVQETKQNKLPLEGR